MQTIGLSFFSGGLQYALAENDGSTIKIIEREKCMNPAPDRIRESANWLHDTFVELYGRHNFTSVGFKLHYDLKRINDLYAHGLPVGVIASFCAENNISIEGYTVRSIKGYRFLSLPKGTQTLDWINSNHRDEGLYWNNDARYAVAIALKRALELG